MRRIFIALAQLSVVFAGVAVLARDTTAPNPIAWRLDKFPEKPVRAGSSFNAVLVATIEDGWHLYALDEPDGGPVATEITVPGNSAFQLGVVRASKPIILFDPNFAKRLAIYVSHAEFRLPLTATRSADARGALAIQVRYQCCNDKLCLPPRQFVVKATD